MAALVSTLTSAGFSFVQFTIAAANTVSGACSSTDRKCTVLPIGATTTTVAGIFFVLVLLVAGGCGGSVRHFHNVSPRAGGLFLVFGL